MEPITFILLSFFSLLGVVFFLSQLIAFVFINDKGKKKVISKNQITKRLTSKKIIKKDDTLVNTSLLMAINPSLAPLASLADNKNKYLCLFDSDIRFYVDKNLFNNLEEGKEYTLIETTEEVSFSHLKWYEKPFLFDTLLGTASTKKFQELKYKLS